MNLLCTYHLVINDRPSGENEAQISSTSSSSQALTLCDTTPCTYYFSVIGLNGVAALQRCTNLRSITTLLNGQAVVNRNEMTYVVFRARISEFNHQTTLLNGHCSRFDCLCYSVSLHFTFERTSSLRDDVLSGRSRWCKLDFTLV